MQHNLFLIHSNLKSINEFLKHNFLQNIKIQQLKFFFFFEVLEISISFFQHFLLN